MKFRSRLTLYSINVEKLTPLRSWTIFRILEFFSDFSLDEGLNSQLSAVSLFWDKNIVEVFTIHFKRSRWHCPSREHIGNIDDLSKLSSITPMSMMHPFYIEFRKPCQIFEVISMIHPCFQCFSTLGPAMFHLLNMNDSTM